MSTYSFLRELADSWVLLALTLFFLGTIVWAYRPGSREIHQDTADIPFRNDTLIAADVQVEAEETAPNTEGKQ
ncbi:Cbb3-type cytochrome c oxidase CcoQ subunit [Rhodobacterales bacterium HTCC2150]|nr:Cbb3-type cytochrome c oxidase CcoQ subunit [Rhodobacterales bacterium HTCC2150] [Rhodobacteraceae bacterium HTCC2150]